MIRHLITAAALVLVAGAAWAGNVIVTVGSGSCSFAVSSLNLGAAPTCATAFALSSSLFANQGTSTTVLHGNASGNPTWGSVTSSDVSGTTGSGNFVLASSPTLTTPTIGSFTNATHDHTNAAGGGTLNAGSVFSAGLVPLARGGTHVDLSATGGTSQVLKQTSVGGDVTVARLACSDLSDSAATCATNGLNASNISSGTLGLARGGTNADLSATGGASQFLKQASVGAAVTVVRPACADLSNSAPSCSTDATNAGNISAGTLALARGGTNADLSATGGASQFLKQASVGAAVTVVRPACADLSNAATSCSTDATNASNIASGTLGLARGGTNADLSATGGANQFLRQNSSGAAITVVQPSCSSLSNAATSCSTDATNASNISSGTLGLARGGTGADLSTIAKGGLIVGSGAGTVGLTTIGTDGCVLRADSTQTNGLLWSCQEGLYYVKSGITNNVAVSLLRMTAASNTTTGAAVFWRITATDGTDFQSKAGGQYLVCINKAGTMSLASSAFGTQSQTGVATTGTQTITSGVVAGAGFCDVNFTSNSTLTSPTTTAAFSYFNLGSQAMTPQ